MSEATKERAAFAGWLARQHLRFDKRLTEIVHLPVGAPDDAVRLLEVNTGLFPDSDAPLTPIETTPAVTDLPFHVWVVDVTPDEWARIQADPALLPPGWSLEEKQIIKRGK